jgi:hypothetical protein
MSNADDRREQERLRFYWPLWFGYEENCEFLRGQIVDLNNQCVRFSLNRENSPQLGDHLLIRFSYPLNTEYSFEMGTYFQWGEVIRIDHGEDFQSRIALRLSLPLPHQLFPLETDHVVSLTA